MHAQINRQHKPDGVHACIEKYLLRKAFDTPQQPYLPEDVLWRQKEQFSDGVGYDWVDRLKDYAQEVRQFWRLTLQSKPCSRTRMDQLWELQPASNDEGLCFRSELRHSPSLCRLTGVGTASGVDWPMSSVSGPIRSATGIV